MFSFRLPPREIARAPRQISRNRVNIEREFARHTVGITVGLLFILSLFLARFLLLLNTHSIAVAFCLHACQSLNAFRTHTNQIQFPNRSLKCRTFLDALKPNSNYIQDKQRPRLTLPTTNEQSLLSLYVPVRLACDLTVIRHVNNVVSPHLSDTFPVMPTKKAHAFCVRPFTIFIIKAGKEIVRAQSSKQFPNHALILNWINALFTILIHRLRLSRIL